MKEKKSQTINKAFENALYRLINVQTGLIVQDHQREGLWRYIESNYQKYGCDSVEDYVDLLKKEANTSSRIINELIAAITVEESHFFRDEFQMNFLYKEFLPDLIQKKREQNSKTIRIWSAGCAAGQELYTIAIMLQDLLPDYASWNLHLLGTDINTQVLAKAVRGEYREWAFRGCMPERFRMSCFHEDAGVYHIKPSIRKMAKFAYLNLVEDVYPSILSQTNTMDLVLCRNVFIYFRKETIIEVINRLKHALVSGGVLMLGASDFSGEKIRGLKRHYSENLNYFERVSGAYQSDVSTDIDSSVLLGLVTAETEAVPVKPVIENKPAPKTKQPAKPIKKAKPLQKPKPAKKAEPIIPRKKQVASLDQLYCHIDQSEWQEALTTVDILLREHPKDSQLILEKARVLANLGAAAEARDLCDQSIELDDLNPKAYFVKGLLMEEVGELTDAEAAFKQAIFLDPGFSEAHFQLGFVYMQLNQNQKGVKSLKNALKHAEKIDPNKSVQFSRGMTFGRLAEILRNEIDIYESDE